MLQSEELGQLAEGASLGWRISSDMHDRRLDVIQHKRAGIPKEVRIEELHLLTESVEHLVDLEVVMQYCSVRCEVSHGDALLEHVPVPHIDPQPQLEPMVFGE